MDFVRDWQVQAADPLKPVDASVQVLPIALYSENKVAVTVKCTDAVTSVALFDGIQFNAYFQRPPVFDISSGVIISTLRGRQVATQAAYNNPSSQHLPSDLHDRLQLRRGRDQPDPSAVHAWSLCRTAFLKFQTAWCP